MTLSNDLQFATTLARSAGKIVSDFYGKVQRLTKTHIAADQEAVTEADRASQRFIVENLRKQFPTDGIIGEESETGTSITFDVSNIHGRNWVIDPIDGTNNFIGGLGNFAVCIGLLDQGFPVLGVVYDVTRNIMYAGAKGLGVRADDQPIRAAQTPISDSSLVMMTSNVINKAGHVPGWASRWIGQTMWKSRILGSAALEATAVAAGVAHAAVTVNGKLWDATAPAALVLEAGGIFTTLDGKPIFPFDLKNYTGAKVPFLAAGPAAHPTILKEIQDHP